ncbi:MAG: tetrahydrofolate dehydrogenase/cyclohydrolase catalytic domain-containing protein, partial [Clostridia bacterium]
MNIIDGKLVAKLTREDITKQVASLPTREYGEIGLAVILVGENPASQVYVRNKINGCAEVGINSVLIKMDATATFDEVLGKIEELNNDPDINGILLQLPV